MAEADNSPRVMRIMQRNPSADWERIWNNLHECWTTEVVKMNWYVVIQDILPTNERLHKIRLVDSPLCGNCGEPDTVQHRVPACGEGARIWIWTKRHIALILRTDPAHIPPDWTRPQFRMWPPQRHQAVLWILAQMVWYRIKESRACNEKDYSDFLRRTRWKADQNKHRRTNVGNYLEILWQRSHKRDTPWSGSVGVTLLTVLWQR